jgi:hypothetical protein
MQRRTNRKRKELKASSRERDRDFFFLFCVDIGTSFESVGALEKGGGRERECSSFAMGLLWLSGNPLSFSLSLSLFLSRNTHIFKENRTVVEVVVVTLKPTLSLFPSLPLSLSIPLFLCFCVFNS